MGAVGHSKKKIEVSLLYPLKRAFRTTSSPSCLDPFWVRMPGQESSSQLTWKKREKEKKVEKRGRARWNSILFMYLLSPVLELIFAI